MANQPSGDRIWLALCTVAGVAVNVTLDKYSSSLPGLAVVLIWAVPAILFVVWFIRVETTKNWVKSRFMQNPASYVLMFLILIPFGWVSTSMMIAKLQTKSIPQALPTSTGLTPTKITPPLSPDTRIAVAPTLNLPPIKPPSKTVQHTQFESPAVMPAPGSISTQAIPTPTYQQQCTGPGPCAQGPGAQATTNIHVGYVPPPPRTISAQNELAALSIMKSAPKGSSVYFVYIGIDNESIAFQKKIRSLFEGWSLAGEESQPSWSTMIQLGNGPGDTQVINSIGIGCTSTSEAGELAKKALAASKFPCSHSADGRYPQRIAFPSPGNNASPPDIVVSIGPQ